MTNSNFSVNEFKPVYTNKEVMELLGIKAELLRKLRNEGYLGYTKYPGLDKCWYTAQNIIDFLNNPVAVHQAWK